MRMFHRKRIISEKDQSGLRAAQRAEGRADASLKEAQGKNAEVTKVTVQLKRARKQNNFAAAVREALRGEPG